MSYHQPQNWGERRHAKSEEGWGIMNKCYLPKWPRLAWISLLVFLYCIPWYRLWLHHLGFKPQCLLLAPGHVWVCSFGSASKSILICNTLFVPWWPITFPTSQGPAVLATQLRCQSCDWACHLDIFSRGAFHWLLPSQSLIMPPGEIPNENFLFSSKSCVRVNKLLYFEHQ